MTNEELDKAILTRNLLARIALFGTAALFLTFAYLANAATFDAPVAVTPYAQGLAITSGAQVYICPVPIIAHYDGTPFVASGCSADRIFSGSFQ